MTIVAKDVGPVGGMELQLTELISGLLRIGCRVTVISSTCALPPHPGLRWIRVPGPARPFSIAYPWFILLASLLVRLHGRGIVHSTGAMILNRADVCTVHYCHRAASQLDEFARVSRPGRAYRLNARIASRLSLWGESWCYRPGRVGALVGVSQGVARELDLHFPELRPRILVIPNGVDTDVFRPPPGDGDGGAEDGLRAVFVGSEWERKGLRVAIDALARSPGVSLTVVGDGDVETYGRLAEERGLRDRIEFVGASAEVAEWYRQAEVFVLPTAYETFSLVTYEAAASGLPLLVTRVNGVEDLLQDGVNGWFVERDAESVAARLRELRSDPELRKKMGHRAREDSMRFAWSRVVVDYAELYARISRSAMPPSGELRLRRSGSPASSPSRRP